MAKTTAQQKGHDLLGIYLNDHLAGATGGVGLARRMAAAADPGSKSARILSTLAAEITQDRVALIKIMGTLGIPVRGYKVFAGWAGEKAGRVKLNGHLLTRSPLSELEETELLRLGVEGKAAGWRSLRSSPSGTAAWTRTGSTISSIARNASRTCSKPSGSPSRNGFSPHPPS